MKIYVVNIAAFTAIGTATAAAQFLLIVLFLLAAAASNTNCTNIVVAVGAADSVIKTAARTEQQQQQQQNHQSPYHHIDHHKQDEELKTTTKSPTFLNIDNSEIFSTATKINGAPSLSPSSSSSSSSSVNDISFLVFKPSLLDFKNQPVGDAFNDVVTIFNKHTNRSVYLGSISGTVPDFYSSFFEEKVIPPLGNTTFNVVFLPRQPGDIQTSLLIHTSFGVTNYTLRGRGVECIFRLSPLVGLKAPFNATLTPEIVMYNPYDIPLQIVEVYSSGGKFQLELPSGGSEAPQTLWEIPPFSSKPVIRVRFKATSSGNHTAYVRIKVSAESKPELEDLVLVVPIEVEIDTQNGVYTEIPMINFGIGGETDRPKKLSLNVFNSNDNVLSDSGGGGGGGGGGGAGASSNNDDKNEYDSLVEIEDYMVEASDDVVAALSLHIAKVTPISLPVPASSVADISSNKGNENVKSSTEQNDEGPHHKPCHYITATIDWSKLKTEERVFRGHIALRAHHKQQAIRQSGAAGGDDNDENHRRKENNQIHRIPFIGEVLPGSIYYNESYTQFLTGTEGGGDSSSSSTDSGSDSDDLASGATDRSSSNGMSSNSKTIKSTKNFIIKNNFQFPLAITNITVDDDTAKYFKISGFIPKILATQEESQLFKIKYLTVALKRPLTKSIWLHTNTSLYEIGLKTYTGLLRRIVPVDENTLNSGINIDERAVNFGTLPISTVTDTLMAFANESPIPITIHNWTATISDVASIYVILRGCGNLTTENLKFCYSIPPKEWIFFQVSVLSNAVGTFFGKLAIKTDFEELVTPVRFSTAIGQLQFSSAMQGETKCFPGGVCSVNLTAHSTFIQPMTVKEILVNVTGGVSYSYSSNQFPVIEPNEFTYIGQLQFTPKALCGTHECYVAFPDQWHPTVLSTNCRNKEPNDLLTKILEEYRKMKSSFSTIIFRVKTNQVRRHDFNGSVDLLWPKLVDPTQIEFPVFQVGEDVFVDILVTNPIDQPINVYFMMHDVGQMGTSMTFPPEIISHCWDCFLARENVFSFVNNNDKTGSDEKLSGFHIIPPYSSEKITVKFLSQTAGTFSNLFYIRNNFTVLEAIWITAVAAPHQFKFGNRKPGSVTPLVFELSNKHFRDCDRKQLPSNTDTPPKISAKRTFTAKNTGDEPIDVYGMYIEGIRCVGYGFRVLDCWNFRLPPNSSKKVEIVFTPDFTLSRVSRVLSIDTSLGYAINYTLLSLVPAHALNACAKILRRPSWEHQLQFASFIVLSISFLLVIIAAFFDSDKVLKDHVNNMSKDKGPVQPTLDLRQVGLRNSSLFDDNHSLTNTTTIVTATTTSVTSPISNGSSSCGGGGGNNSNHNINQGKPYPYLRKKQLKKTENHGSTETLPCGITSGGGGSGSSYGNNKKSWATVLARKFSPIKSDVKFREVTPSPPPASSSRNDTNSSTTNSASKKENTKKQHYKDLMDTATTKKSNDDDSSSTTTETSTVSFDTPSIPAIPVEVFSVTKKQTSPSKKSSCINETSSPLIVEITPTTAVIIQKSKSKTSVKKTKSLPLNGTSTKEINTGSAAALDTVTITQQQNSLAKNSVSPPVATNPTTKMSNNRTIETRSKINPSESSTTPTTFVKDSFLSTPPSGQNAIDQNQHSNSNHQNHHHYHNHQNHHQQQQQQNQQDNRSHQSSNIKKHGKTPGRERRKNDSTGASGGGSGSGSSGNGGNVNGRKSSHSKLSSGATNNLATTPKHSNDTFNRTAFQFSSPLSNNHNNNNIGFGGNNNNAVTASSLWDTNRVSFSNIVAQTPYYSGAAKLADSGFSIPQTIPQPSSTSAPSSPQQVHSPLPTINQPTSKPSSPLSNHSISNTTEFSSLTQTPITTRPSPPPPVTSSTTTTTAVSLAQNPDGIKMSKKNLLQFFTPVEDNKFIDLDLLMKSIERSMDDVLLTNTKPTNTTVNDLGPIGTRKSPSSTPVWEPLPNIQKPIAVTTPNSPSSPLSGGSGISSGSGISGISGESGRNNPNSFFSGEFPKFSSNSTSTHFPLSSAMDNINNSIGGGNGMGGLGGISGLLDNVYEDKLQQPNHQKISSSSSKRNNWDQETFLSILQQIQQNQNHQNQNQQPTPLPIELHSSSSSSSSPQPPPHQLLMQQQQQQNNNSHLQHHQYHPQQQQQQHNSFDQHNSLDHLLSRQQQEQQLEHQQHQHQQQQQQQQQQQTSSFYSNDLWNLCGNGIVSSAVGQDYSQSNGNWLHQGLIRPPPGIDRIVQPRFRYRNGDIQDIVPSAATNVRSSPDNIHQMQSLYQYPQQSTHQHHQNQLHHSHHQHQQQHHNDGISRRFNDSDSAQYLPQYNPFSSLSSIWSSDPWTTLMPSASSQQQSPSSSTSSSIAMAVPGNNSSISDGSGGGGGGGGGGVSAGGVGDRNTSPVINVLSSTLSPNEISK